MQLFSYQAILTCVLGSLIIEDGSFEPVKQMSKLIDY